jgi:hypothetical protein
VVTVTGLPASVVETVGERLVAEGAIIEEREGYWLIPGLDIRASHFNEGPTIVLQLKVMNFRLYSLLLQCECSVDGGRNSDVQRAVVGSAQTIPAAPFRPSRGMEPAAVIVISVRYPDDFTSDTTKDLSERVPGQYRATWEVQIESPVQGWMVASRTEHFYIEEEA